MPKYSKFEAEILGLYYIIIIILYYIILYYIILYIILYYRPFIWHQKGTTSGWALGDENAMGTYHLIYKLANKYSQHM